MTDDAIQPLAPARPVPERPGPAGLAARPLTRRHALRRMTAALGAALGALAAPPAPSAAARELTLARAACACGAARTSAASASQTAARALQPATAPVPLRAFENLVGWGYTVRARIPRAELLADLRRMRDLGCNTVYIAPDNPGDTNPDGYEPGLFPGIWYAIAAGTPEAANAWKIARSVLGALDAAAEVGLEVVLGIGYQIQMGEEWNAAHPAELRLDRDGQLMSQWSSGFTASPYSAVYRRDVQEYYAWVDETFVRRHPHVVALNLADEPMGADYSPHAMAEFERRYGHPFDTAPFAERGEFLTGVIPDYAAWSAEVWQRLNPDIRTMMTFHVQRDAPFLPDVERTFAQTPPTFVFSADTHLDDGTIDRVITPENTRLLYGMVRTFGWLSQVYRRPLMLWTSANAWGLKRNGGPAEARLNLQIVHDAAKQGGGQIGMLMAWGWNIFQQGVYDDRGNFPANKDEMIAVVSQGLAARREQLSLPSTSRPERVVYVPAEPLHARIGEERVHHIAEGVVDLRGIDFARENAVYLTDGRALEEARRLGIAVTPL